MAYEVFQGKDDQWYWRMMAPNGEIVASSEGYTRKEDAERSAGNIAAIASEAGIEVNENEEEKDE